MISNLLCGLLHLSMVTGSQLGKLIQIPYTVATECTEIVRQWKTQLKSGGQWSTEIFYFSKDISLCLCVSVSFSLFLHGSYINL